VDEKLLLKHFNADPGAAFIEVIRTANGTVDSRQIIDRFTAVGAKPAVVKAKWETYRKFVKVHPNIRKASPTKYEWSPEPISSHEALNLLSTYVNKSTPTWLTGAYIQTITDSLAGAETTGPNAQSTWTEERELQKAQVLAEALSGIEAMVENGASAAEVLKWLLGEAQGKRLRQTPRIGDQVPFNPEDHDVQGSRPTRGTQVRVVRSGYKWIFGTREDVVVRAVTQALTGNR
jgi:hypothetical protein